MKLCTILLCALSATSSAALAQSPSACRWLTLGSAEKALGGDATVVVQQPTPPEGACRFALKSNPESILEITVSKTRKRICADGSLTLTGLGNEAWQCVQKSEAGKPIDVIEARIRDLNYVIVMTRPVPSQRPVSKSLSPIPVVPTIQAVSDLVAGTLY